MMQNSPHVVPAKAGTQYAARSRFNLQRSGILDPAFAGMTAAFVGAAASTCGKDANPC
jgi:hypothetical protein